MAEERIVAEEVRKTDKRYVSPNGEITSTIERYILTVLPENIQDTIRAVALYEIQEQQKIGNDPSQVLVDGASVGKRGVMAAKKRVVARFQDVNNLLEAVKEIFQLLQRVTRIQNPPKNNIVARENFHLWLNGVNLGRMPEAISKIAYPGILTQDSLVQVVGPVVPYGRKSFWNPVGLSAKMSYYRVASKRSGVRFMVPKGSSIFYPRFRPYKLSTMRKKANKSALPAETLKNMLSGATPPGRAENVGQMIKRIIKRNPAYKGLHFTDGWVKYGPAMGWSKIRDPRIPAFGVMLSKKGKLNNERA